MKPTITRTGPACDYTGAHVTMEHEGRTLLGVVVHVCPDENLCIVRHFNGEPWPVNPSLGRLDILERTYDTDPEES